MKPVKLLPKHFANTRCVLMPDAVSNGSWAIRRAYVANSAVFATEETARAFLDTTPVSVVDTTFSTICADAGDRHEWSVTAWRYVNGKTVTAMLVNSKTGELSHVQIRYLALADLDTPGSVLYAASKTSPFQDAPTVEDSSFVVMPCRIVDQPPCARAHADEKDEKGDAT